MYYETRIDKIPKCFINGTILNSTWLANNKNNYCKPMDDDELKKCLNAYSLSKKHELKIKIYEGTLWYAAYCAVFTYKLYHDKFPTSEYDDHLSYCLERLMLKIEDWDPKLSNGASFYTRVLSDIKWSVKTYLLDEYGEGLCTRAVSQRSHAAINKMLVLGYSFDEAVALNDSEFKNRFLITKQMFLNYLKSSLVVSGNETISLQNDNDCFEIFDFVEDDYNSSFVDRVIATLTTEEIYKLAKYKFKEKEHKFYIWKDYKSGNYSYEDLAKKWYNPPCTRERIRQIVSCVDRSLNNSRNFMNLKNEYYL